MPSATPTAAVVGAGLSGLTAAFRLHRAGRDVTVFESEPQVVPSSPSIGILRDGRVHLLPLDRIVRSGLSTRLLSRRAKARLLTLARDVVVARLRHQLDYTDMRRSAPIDTESARNLNRYHR